jgi:hypothetical protein
MSAKESVMALGFGEMKMRKMFFSAMALILAAFSGCGPNSDPGQTAGASQAFGGGGGVSLYPLSSGGRNGQDAYPGQISPERPMDQIAAPRQPSPYDALLANRTQPYALNQIVSPAYSIQSDGYPIPTATHADPATASRPDMIQPTISAGTAAAGDSIRLLPALDVPPGIHANDVAPSQWFEIVRPANGPLRIGRLTTTCGCIMARAPKRRVPAGERALIEVRTLTRPPINHITYGMYVSVLEPEKLTLDIDVTVNY